MDGKGEVLPKPFTILHISHILFQGLREDREGFYQNIKSAVCVFIYFPCAPNAFALSNRSMSATSTIFSSKHFAKKYKNSILPCRKIY